MHSDFKSASRIEMSAQSVLQLCGEIKPQLPKLAQGYNNNAGRGSQWKNVQRNVNSRCDRAQILKRRNNQNSAQELANAETYLRDIVLPGIREYTQSYNSQNEMLGGRRRKTRKNRRKNRKTRRSKNNRR